MKGNENAFEMRWREVGGRKMGGGGSEGKTVRERVEGGVDI